MGVEIQNYVMLGVPINKYIKVESITNEIPRLIDGKQVFDEHGKLLTTTHEFYQMIFEGKEIEDIEFTEYLDKKYGLDFIMYDQIDYNDFENENSIMVGKVLFNFEESAIEVKEMSKEEYSELFDDIKTKLLKIGIEEDPKLCIMQITYS